MRLTSGERRVQLLVEEPLLLPVLVLLSHIALCWVRGARRVRVELLESAGHRNNASWLINRPQQPGPEPAGWRGFTWARAGRTEAHRRYTNCCRATRPCGSVRAPPHALREQQRRVMQRAPATPRCAIRTERWHRGGGSRRDPTRPIKARDARKRAKMAPNPARRGQKKKRTHGPTTPCSSRCCGARLRSAMGGQRRRGAQVRAPFLMVNKGRGPKIPACGSSAFRPRPRGQRALGNTPP